MVVVAHPPGRVHAGPSVAVVLDLDGRGASKRRSSINRKHLSGVPTDPKIGVGGRHAGSAALVLIHDLRDRAIASRGTATAPRSSTPARDYCDVLQRGRF